MMKKIMVAVAIAVMATFAEAAAVDWTANGVVDPVATAAAGKNTPANGWVGYVVMAADLASVTADLDAGNTATLLSSAVGPVKNTTNKGAYAAGVASGDVAAGSQTFYLVVLNAESASAATSYFTSAAANATVDASLDTVITFGSQATVSKDSSSWKSVGGSVPEPTSGLLILLGVAGLALKRKLA